MERAATLDSSTPYWRSDLTNGWLYLLPPLSTRRVLCLSAQPDTAASQAHLFRQLTLLSDARMDGLMQASVTPREEAGMSVQWQSVSEIAALPESADRFDGLIIHDPEGRIVHKANLPQFEQMLRDIRPALRSGAFVYVGMRHAWSPQQIAARLSGSKSGNPQGLCSVSRVRRSLRAAGLVALQAHPYLMWGSRMAEVVPEQGYRASKNREILRERIKETVFNRWGARVFAPAYGLVGFVSHPEDSTLELLMKHVAQAPYAPDRASAVLKQYLVFPGDKAIVSFGPPHRDDADVVAILAGDALAIERRHAETKTLATLGTLPSPLARMVPRLLDQFRIGSTCAFVLNRFPGVSLDLDIKALDRVSDNALQFIVDLHRQTAQTVLIDAGSFQARLGSLLDAAAARNPALATALRSWEKPLQSLLIGTTMPIVWLHGDFKVENVLYDEHSQALTGVIDWELAMLPGLPLLDPLYLLIYNRLIRGADWVEVLLDMLVKAKYTPAEFARLHSYMDSLGIPHNRLPALSAAFIAHHIGCRLHLWSQAAYIEPLRKILEEMCTVLEQAAATRIQPAAV